MISKDGNRLVYRFDAETLMIEPWGKDSLRIRSTMAPRFIDDDRALTEKAEKNAIVNDMTIENGRIRACISEFGTISIYDSDGRLLLQELSRNRKDLHATDCSAIEIEARTFSPARGSDNYHITWHLKSLSKTERIYGMGQYQQPYLDIKGMDFELAHRNSQASVPFFISSLGYGMLWNNPAIGRAVFGLNIMQFEAYSAKELDIWITAGSTPKEIERNYASVTGKVPMMPEYGLGFWQCKLRYRTQEEVLNVARKYRSLGLPLDVIVIDFFHWPVQGSWTFDPAYFPDPKAMVDELASMDVELMVSIWPTVDRRSPNWNEMLEKGYLIRIERGFRISMDYEGNTVHYDATNPEARKYLWNKIKDNYYRYGIKTFWLDEAEPEYAVYDFDNYRYMAGSDLEVGNIYPLCYARTFYEGQEAEGQKNIVNLLRCAWAGSQKYGALVWSGDIASSYESLRNQLAAGLNMGIAGIPWWTTDIGGFHGGNPQDEGFRELFARWFEWGCFCPVMRLHGDRDPKLPQLGSTGGAHCLSGSDNEVWSYGDEVFGICRKYLLLRERLRPYTREVMKEAHDHGDPVMRPLFYEFPQDGICWTIEDEYMFGGSYLVAPVLEPGARERKVYFPAGSQWESIEDGSVHEGGRSETVAAPLDVIPVFRKK